MVRARGIVGERISAYRVWMGKPEGRGTLGRPRNRLEDYIEMDLRDVGWGGDMEWVDLTQDRDRWWTLLIALMNHWIP
jgi:hypothetical protein